MAEMIDRKVLEVALLERGFDPAIIENILKLVTTVDTVKVVRCRECKHFGVYRYSGNGYCTNDNGYGFPNQKPDDFCSRGERKCNA